MDRIEQAVSQLHQIRVEALADTWMHRIYPVFKLILTGFYLGVVTQIPLEEGEVLLSMGIYLVFLFVAGEISFYNCLSRLWITIPFVAVMGVYPLFAERDVRFCLGIFPLTTGMLHFFLLFLKGIYSVLAVYLLISTTTVENIVASLAKLHIPSAILTVILLIYRYIGLLFEETGRMVQAYRLRAPGQRGIAIGTWGSFAGLLLLRSLDRAERVSESMRLRGFQGKFQYWGQLTASWTDWLYFVAMCGMIVALRCVPVFLFAENMVNALLHLM